jgi:dTDP-glucose 4,6-dehydratase
MENRNPIKVVYVTGCLGFIGSYVTRACLEKGWYVRGVDKITYAANPSLLKEFNRFPNFTFEKKDINDIEFLYDCDYIINTAAETHVDNSIIDSEVFLHSNINGVYNLLEQVRKRRLYNMPTLLHFSTDEVYGDIVEGSHKESDLLRPSNPYSATKASADQLVLAWARTYDVPYVIVRPTNNYGIGQYVEKLIPKTCRYLKTNKKINLHNNGDPERVWLHAKDTANVITLIIEKNIKNEIFNISGNLEQKNIDTVSSIFNHYFGEKTNPQDYIDNQFERPGQDVRYSINDDKLKNLGWSPKVNFNKEIKSIVEYYKKHFVW